METSYIIKTFGEASRSIRWQSGYGLLHDSMNTEARMIMPGGDGSEGHEIDINIVGRMMLHMSCSPEALFRYKFNQGDGVSTATRIMLAHHGVKTLTMEALGAYVAGLDVSGTEDMGDGTTKLTVNSNELNYSYLTGRPVAGSFNLNGEHLYLLFGNYSEQKVYLDNVGVLDDNGDKYVYDPEQDMISTGEEGGIEYGYYPRPLPDIVAEGLERCINVMFYIPVVAVTYNAQQRFVIKSRLIGAHNISVLPTYDSVGDLLGLSTGSTLITGVNLSGYRVYVDKLGMADIVEASDNYIIAGAALGQTMPQSAIIIDQNVNIAISVVDI
ncbi:MAG: hypothetical protein Q8M92_04415 [Candidatus Subteraquimicrobiales bacterium]|nr:hypothetical protein [Candidatus Subteraquimicrobiales bacterium]